MKVLLLYTLIVSSAFSEIMPEQRISKLNLDGADLSLWSKQINSLKSSRVEEFDWSLTPKKGVATLLGVMANILDGQGLNCEILESDLGKRDSLIEKIKALKTVIFNDLENTMKFEQVSIKNEIKKLNELISKLNAMKFKKYYQEKRILSYQYSFEKTKGRDFQGAEIDLVKSYQLGTSERVSLHGELENIHGFTQYSYLFGGRNYFFIKRTVPLADYCMKDLTFKLNAEVIFSQKKIDSSSFHQCLHTDNFCPDLDYDRCFGLPTRSYQPRLPIPPVPSPIEFRLVAEFLEQVEKRAYCSLELIQSLSFFWTCRDLALDKGVGLCEGRKLNINVEFN